VNELLSIYFVLGIHLSQEYPGLKVFTIKITSFYGDHLKYKLLGALDALSFQHLLRRSE
jgi:hypothetical protein